MRSRRVVITGMGPVSPIGSGRDTFAEALLAGTSGIAPARMLDVSNCDGSLAAEIAEFDAQALLESRKAYLDRSAQFALGAAALAIRDAGLHASQLSDAGICLGTSCGSMGTLGMFFEGYLEKGPRFVKPFLFQHTYANTAIGLVAIEFGIGGPHLNVAGGLTAGANAIVTACDLVASGTADCVIAGGYDALSDYLYAGLDHDGLICADSEYSPSVGPFGAERDGYIPGEGAGVLVLEELGAARERGARIHAEVVSAGMGGASHEGDAADLAQTILDVLDPPKTVASPEIGARYVFASANGSLETDEPEADALRAFAQDVRVDRVASIKQRVGETFAAGPALQVMAACAAMDAGTLPEPLMVALPGIEDTAVAAADIEAIITAIDPGGSVAALLLRSMREPA